MKRICLLASLLCCMILSITAQTNPKPFVIPELKEWKGNTGTLTLNENTRIVYPKNQPELQRIAQLVADDCKEMFDYAPTIAEGKGQKGDIILALKKDKKLGKEGYAINISDRITLSAPEAVGVYWGTRTLLQMAEQGFELPKGEIRDFPDYAIRGFMIDCGRKFIPMHYLRDYVKIMSYYKMNCFQIHLNDNGFKQFFEHDWDKTYAAFRLESDTYPGLTAVMASIPRRNSSTFRFWPKAFSWKSFLKSMLRLIPWHSLTTCLKSARRNTVWTTSTSSTRRLTNSWTASSRNTWKVKNRCSVANVYTSVPTNTPTRTRR